MFCKEVIGSDKFLDLPVSSRELYFQLGMYADDDGFITPKKVIRMVGASDDDIKVLILKGFVIPFESGVVVIKHWRENNYLRNDRHKPTLFQEEFKIACQDKVYLGIPNGIPNGSPEEIRLDKIRKEENSSFKRKLKPYYHGQGMRQSRGKWWIVPNDGGSWLEYAGKESEIEWK